MSIAVTSSKTRHAAPGKRHSTERALHERHTSRMVSNGFETLALLVIAALLIAGTILSARTTAPTPAFAPITVRTGDSLWTLAAEHPVESLTTAQVAELISRANQREGALLTPGEYILVPAGLQDERLAVR